MAEILANIPTVLKARLDCEALRTGTSVSNIVVSAVERYLEESRHPAEMSVFDRGPGGVVSEPLFAPRDGGDPARDDDGYLISAGRLPTRRRRTSSLPMRPISKPAPAFRGRVRGSLGSSFHGSWWADRARG